MAAPARHRFVDGRFPITLILAWAFDVTPQGVRAADPAPGAGARASRRRYPLSLAQIYAWTGDSSEALALIQKSLQTPNGISPALLGIDVTYDPLRSDPRFKAFARKIPC